MARTKEKNNIIKFHNDLNLMALKNYTKTEQNFFMSILYKLMNQDELILRINFSELKNLTSFEQNYERLVEAIKNICEKMIKSIIKVEENEYKTAYITIFEILKIDENEKFIEAQMTKSFKYLVNELKSGNFTIIELVEFNNLSSRYTQTLYRILKQFKTTGFRVLKWNEFLEIMDIPKGYEACDIDSQILKPAVKELSDDKNLFNQNRIIFKNLSYKKNKLIGNGNEIYSIEFKFDIDNNTTNKYQKECFISTGMRYEIKGVEYKIDKLRVKCINLSTKAQVNFIFEDETQLQEAIRSYKEQNHENKRNENNLARINENLEEILAKFTIKL